MFCNKTFVHHVRFCLNFVRKSHNSCHFFFNNSKVSIDSIGINYLNINISYIYFLYKYLNNLIT